MDPLLFKADQRTLSAFGDGRGLVAVGRDMTADNNAVMGCGRAEFEDCELTATIPYDEYLYCVEGEIGIRIGDRNLVLRRHDAVWLSRGTQLTYLVKGHAVGVYAFTPVNWRQPEAG